MIFSNSLIQWYLANKRVLPWRETRDPYAIWLSEIILQQTRVLQGLPYYEAFFNAFPTVQKLAAAPEEEVLKLWQGLGYYSRARNMHATAQYVVNELQGVFPVNYCDLLGLKGVGRYTAAAIASFAFDEPVAVVDGNVYRVLSRYFGVLQDISASKAFAVYFDLAMQLLPKDNAALFNQAIMEFGAIQCVPKNPNCSNCVFSSSCYALQKGMVSELPFKLKKTKITKRYLNYIVFRDLNDNTVVRKRDEKGIWFNLYEFPCLETTHLGGIDETEELIRENFLEYNIKGVHLITKDFVLHKLSHQHLYIRFWEVRCDVVIQEARSWFEIEKYPYPIVIHNFISAYSANEHKIAIFGKNN